MPLLIDGFNMLAMSVWSSSERAITIRIQRSQYYTKSITAKLQKWEYICLTVANKNRGWLGTHLSKSHFERIAGWGLNMSNRR